MLDDMYDDGRDIAQEKISDEALGYTIKLASTLVTLSTKYPSVTVELVLKNCHISITASGDDIKEAQAFKDSFTAEMMVTPGITVTG